jgi:hypothetical protein
MTLNWLDWLGDWNPQLLRELKGRFKPRNLLIAGATSLLGQFLLFMFFKTQLPTPTDGVLEVYNKYCLVNPGDYRQLGNCLQDNQGNFLIDWQLWWLSLFASLSAISIFGLLVAGTYLLISDLANEEHRNTLNFLRFSPQPPASILVGKLLGVPILLYLVAGLAVPLHLWSGLAAQLPLSLILSFYGVLIASCVFFYSAALLFGLVGSWLGDFQAWLGSGTVLIFLWSSRFGSISHSPADLRDLFSPYLILQYLVAATGLDSQSTPSYMPTEELQWFYLPLKAAMVGVVGFALVNYGLWTYWSWQALKRRFPNPSKTILSKQQSYLVVACFEVLILGFALQEPKWMSYTTSSFNLLLGYNSVLFLSLILALTPGRQALQDWTRYRRERVSSRKVWNRTLVRDLVWGEKSPALVAIALNLVIATTILVPWIVFGLEEGNKLPVLFSLVISINLTLIYAAIAQLIVFLRTQKQGLWVTGTVGAVALLPPVILGLLSLYPDKAPGLWLFTPFAWASIGHASATTVFLALLGQWSLLTLFTLQMTRQLRRAGESASMELFAERL